MAMIAKTQASGGTGLLPEILAFTSSLALDRALLREDLIGSMAHLTMLARQRIIPLDAARVIHRGLADIWATAERGELSLPDEEDVHMAVEGILTGKLGEPAGLLHTARSRNDQVALDLRLHVREACARLLEQLAGLLTYLCDRAEHEKDTLLPAYTHRQRAQPISLAYLLSGYGAMFARDVEALEFVLSQVDTLPLGVGAIAGTSLPTDRDVTRKLLRFSRLTSNGLDTVGDRDFALDYTYAGARMLLHTSRVAADFVDFSSSEFGFVKLDGAIACGSSMMPQKRNPDVFELIRGKSGKAVGNVVSLMVTLKGLPGGYNRDLQEDRDVILETGPLLTSVLSALELGLRHVEFDREKCLRVLELDYTQATDLAEALVKKGVPFRTAYKAVGALVSRCQEQGLPLAQATLELARPLHPAFDDAVLSTVTVKGAVDRKENKGGTGPTAIREQLVALRASADRARGAAQRVPKLGQLFAELSALEDFQ